MPKDTWLEAAVQQAKQSSCLRRHCGSILVYKDKIIGQGFNSPPKNLESQRRCNHPIDKLQKYPTDKTCCIHAEIRAIHDALRAHPKETAGSDLYFISIDSNDQPEEATFAYCTVCSKQALDVGIRKFNLWDGMSW